MLSTQLANCTLAGDRNFCAVTYCAVHYDFRLNLAAAQAHVKIGHNGAGVRATLASRSIKAGEVVIHVPANLTITLATVREHSLAVSARTPVGKCFAPLCDAILSKEAETCLAGAVYHKNLQRTT